MHDRLGTVILEFTPSPRLVSAPPPSFDPSEAPTAPDVLPMLAPEVLVATLDDQGRLARANSAWTSVFGEEPLWGRLAPEDRRFAREYVQEASQGSLVTQQLFLVERPDHDQPAPVLLHFLPAAVPEARSGRLPIVITGELLQEPKRWTQDQTKRRRMEMLGQMAMGIAHDFNNLLTTVLGHVELLQQGGSDTDSAAHSIERAALDGAALVRKIQRYIRHEKLDRFETVDLAAVVEEVASLTRPYWHNEPRRRGIAIRLRREIEAVPPLRGAEAELREVFVNLVLNAVQAMPEGGLLTLRVFGDARGVFAEVEDTGVGMPESVRRRVFEPLFTTKGEHGTGMGLTVCYGIVEEHDGGIDVRSRPGHGTCFTLHFPPAESAPPPRPAPSKPSSDRIPVRPAPPPPTPERSLRVLVVDDEPMVRAVTSQLLRLRKHEVTEAESGPDALRLAADRDFDLVITDLGMPEMSGRELSMLLRERYPALPIIMLTGHTDAEDAAEHVDAVVVKPFKIAGLEETIRRVTA